MYRTRQRPEGQETRGKTAPNRLRRLDVFVAWAWPELVARTPGGPVVDLGFGRVPRTTLEMAARLRRGNPALEVIGVEIDKERVEAAAPFADDRTLFVRGGFELTGVPPARLIRAMNVLRQYDEHEVSSAFTALRDGLEEGGRLIEGTCDPFGQVIAVHLLQRRGGTLCSDGLLFSTNLRQGADPAMFQPVLPKSLIHRVVPGEPVFDLFEAWRGAWRASRALEPFGPGAVFRETTRQLARAWPIDRRGWLARHGYVWIRSAGPGWGPAIEGG